MIKNIFVCFLFVLVAGCKPYNKPVYVEAENNEEVLVIPLEGETSSQVRYESEEFLAQNQVAVKRIQIIRRWNKTGWTWLSGEYIPTVRVVKVDRSPQTRTWSAKTNTGIWSESSDSVGFSIDMVCTAMIKGSDVPKFMYNYPASAVDKEDSELTTKYGIKVSNSSLEYFMDTEIRARIQESFAKYSGKYKMDELREKKIEIMDQIVSDVIPFFAARGITITTLGFAGGLEYENPDIQKVIDGTFQDQQEHVSAQAALEAQRIRNETIKLAAEAEAEALFIRADGQARSVERLVQAGGANDLYYRLKMLETFEKGLSQWDGKTPQWFFTGSGAQENLLLQIPSNGSN